ncbi:transglycosylase SLT domain-containing protein [Streptosporangium sp. NPDC004379]|uniref:lytic transglycosylase domain-containing protein n=1 Tax=Streptosporangium sp. NPDC004379 TaxID=3366189 RepID=UPI0036C4B8C9
MDSGTEIGRRRARLAPWAALLAVAALAACGTDPAGTAAVAPSAPASAAERTSPAPRSSPSGGEGGEAGGRAASPDEADLPAPGEPIPRDPAKLARALETTTRRLHDAVDGWTGGGTGGTGGGTAKGRPPRAVVLEALYQQRIYRFTARNPGVASRAFARLPARLAAEARDNTTAIRGLLALAHPVKDASKFRIEEPPAASALLGHFKKAERRFGVEWEVLASVMFAETKFGRVRSPSYVGAKGPMQFMPGTWKAYGMGGDIHDPGDAVMAAANYLHASGAPRDYRRALYAYNHSTAYVDAILLHARQMKRDPRNYYAYYNWQVFVITTKGERRISGP